MLYHNIPIWFYSNLLSPFFAPLPFLFTFQYGSIQMNLSISDIVFNSIYIPIWFYSNLFEDKDPDSPTLFTFQYGSIQMEKGL